MSRLITVLRSVIASVLICSASIYGWLLSIFIGADSAARQMDTHPVVYYGIGIAAAMMVMGYGVAGRAREGIPGAVTLLVLGALAPPLNWAISSSTRGGHWFLVALLAAVPIVIFFGGAVVQRRLFPDPEIKEAA